MSHGAAFDKVFLLNFVCRQPKRQPALHLSAARRTQKCISMRRDHALSLHGDIDCA